MGRRPYSGKRFQTNVIPQDKKMEASSLSHSPSSTEQTRQSEFIINVRLILTAEIIKDAISKVLADA